METLQLRALLASLALALPMACGGATDADAAGGSGGMPSAGGGAADGGTSAGGSTGEAGAGSGGDPATGAGGTDECPAAPIARLFPVIGPFWFGPDPGPCSDTDGWTYTYEDDLLASSTQGGGETYVRDEQNRLIEVISDSDPAAYEYVDGEVLETRTSHTAVYTLSERGYPLVASVLFTDSGQVETYDYVYEACRLVLRQGPPGRGDRSYMYDEQGHIATLSDGGSVTTYDYGCW
jgi:hypothetical protein